MEIVPAGRPFHQNAFGTPAGDVAACVLVALRSTFGEPHRGKRAAVQLCSQAEEGVHIVFGWLAVVNPRYGAVEHALPPLLPPVVGHTLHYIHNLGAVDVGRQHQTAVGEPGMSHDFIGSAAGHALVGGGEECGNAAARIAHQQRAVGEAVAVVVHVAAAEQESAVARCFNCGVPQRSLGRSIWLYCVHACKDSD